MMEKSRKKEISVAYKLAYQPMGIFSVRNLATGRQLVGHGSNPTAALNRHRVELRFGTHRNQALMGDWRQFGEAGFAFEILELLKERPEPDFDYPAELESRMAVWKAKVPAGSDASYL